jgi:uncharacterized membrane protein YkvA (DUF1232 family)
MSVIESITIWAKRVKRDAVMLWFARRHPETPFLVKGLCILAVAYALSPIDLIPDFIPVLGYLDEALLLPAMIWLAVRLLPQHVIQACRVEAEQWMASRKSRPKSYLGASAIVLVWLLAAFLCWRWLGR